MILPPFVCYILTKWQFFNSVRDIHETIISRHRSRCSTLTGIGISAVTLCIFTLCKLLILYNNFCCINLHAILIGIASGLDSAFCKDLGSFVEIFLCKLTISTKSNTVDKISCLSILTVTIKSAVYSERISGDCHWLLSL